MGVEHRVDSIKLLSQKKTIVKLEEEITMTQLAAIEAYEYALKADSNADVALLGVIELYEMIIGGVD